MDYIKLQVYMTIEDLPNHLDYSSGIRGIWGRNLKKLFCLQRNIDCKDCEFTNCSYLELFEKHNNTGTDFRPYIIYQEKHSSCIQMNFTFFGELIHQYEKLLLPIIQLNDKYYFFKGQKKTITIHSIKDSENNIVYKDKEIINNPKISSIDLGKDYEKDIMVKFESPLRMKYNNNLMKEFNKEAFVKNLYRRVSFMLDQYDSSQNKLMNLEESSFDFEYSANLRWYEKKRQSLRQNQKMSIGGLIGDIIFKDINQQLYYLLKLGEVLHIGKQSSFGNGKYILMPLNY
ncbi:MAG: CRISPR system precrRNA processing endoribonuclease RAMP protein Cas6 [Candidatus Cloacimonetes bacterium]|nr:CRISPR system precrRNA processing endoribonuclease RAMP protein Cas6 [Candidatus Cloacimonadota bacterium]MDD4155754.1 CRISPR system precrRNA processing endoribonuclease RAMP protein Cas6 [Candidatus Cloacimonadota bacterium]